MRPLLLQHFPGIDVLFSGQVIPCHDAPEGVVAVEQGHGHNIATILQDNALWLMLERNRAAVEIGDGERILRSKATRGVEIRTWMNEPTDFLAIICVPFANL